MPTQASNFWVQVTLAVVLAVAITAATITMTPTSVIDRASATAGQAAEVLTGSEDDPAGEQARSRCWIYCW